MSLVRDVQSMTASLTKNKNREKPCQSGAHLTSRPGALCSGRTVVARCMYKKTGMRSAAGLIVELAQLEKPYQQRADEHKTTCQNNAGAEGIGLPHGTDDHRQHPSADQK